MNTLREIRRRLHSVENVQKITQAMERVAAAKLKKAQTAAEQSRPYALKIKEVIENLATGDISHPLFEKREGDKIGVVIISGDRGLSGSYNSQILAKGDSFLSKYPQDKVSLFLVGKKAVEHYARKGWPILNEKINWGGKITLQEIQHLTTQLVTLFLARKLDEVWLIYTRYITVMSRSLVVEKFLHIEHPPNHTLKNYIFEPSQEEILHELLPRYCVTRIQTGLYEAYAAELAARIVAMQLASKNSRDMIDKLTLVRNKVRQASITKEMIEISSGG